MIAGLGLAHVRRHVPLVLFEVVIAALPRLVPREKIRCLVQVVAHAAHRPSGVDAKLVNVEFIARRR